MTKYEWTDWTGEFKNQEELNITRRTLLLGATATAWILMARDSVAQEARQDSMTYQMEIDKFIKDLMSLTTRIEHWKIGKDEAETEYNNLAQRYNTISKEADSNPRWLNANIMSSLQAAQSAINAYKIELTKLSPSE